MAKQESSPKIDLPQQPALDESVLEEDASAAAPVVAKAKAKPAKSAIPKASVAKHTQSAKTVAAKTNFKAVPMSLDDIDSPELDRGAIAETKAVSKFDEDYNGDYEAVDQAQTQKLNKEKEQMDSLAQATEQEQNNALSAADEANKQDADKFAAVEENLKQKNAQAIAAAEAQENAEREANAKRDAAMAAAAREAAEKRKAALASAAAAEARGTGEGQGDGAGNSGSSQASSQVAGSSSGVRSLDQLRQMPGNPRPQYSPEERLRGDHGQATFVAYVTRDGFLSNFKLVSSTGFRNLDSKTLGALKKWRFYPGQEGWVELPFKWDLKGGVQEYGGRLKVSSNQ
jgi:TonB family protein